MSEEFLRHRLVEAAKRMMPPELVGDDIVGVSPMSAPISSIFALRAKYQNMQLKEDIEEAKSINHDDY